MGVQYLISPHALWEMERRGVSIEIVAQVFAAPEQILDAEFGRMIYQSIIRFEDKPFLVRLIVERDDPLIIITVYRTSKIEKYWSKS